MSHPVIDVLVNAGSGRVDSRPDGEELTTAFASHGLAVRIRVTPGARLTATARAAVREGARIVVAAGGDGTVNAVAAGVFGSEARLAVLPLGTLNHFARDLGLPREPIPAVAALASAIADGHERRIDVGEVNGHLFLNNSSIGLYPALVLERDQERRAFRRGKFQAMAIAIARSSRRVPLQRVRLAIAGRSLQRMTPFVFVANNAYSWRPGRFAQRACLDDGRLWCYFPTRRGTLGLARVLLAAVLGGLGDANDLAGLPVARFTLHSRRRLLPVAMDGEVRHLQPPLHYRCHPRALAVVAPPTDPACA